MPIVQPNSEHSVKAQQPPLAATGAVDGMVLALSDSALHNDSRFGRSCLGHEMFQKLTILRLLPGKGACLGKPLFLEKKMAVCKRAAIRFKNISKSSTTGPGLYDYACHWVHNTQHPSHRSQSNHEHSCTCFEPFGASYFRPRSRCYCIRPDPAATTPRF